MQMVTTFLIYLEKTVGYKFLTVLSLFLRSRRVMSIGLFLCAFGLEPVLAQKRENITELDKVSDSIYTHYYSTGELDNKLIDSVMLLYPENGLSEGKEKLYRILASNYHNIGKPNYAFPYLLEIEKSVRARKDFARLALVLGGIAESYRSFGKYELAIENAEEAIQLAEQYGTELEMGYAHGRLGAILFEVDAKDSSAILPHFRKAIHFYRTINNQREVLSYMGDYANVLYESGEAEKAVSMLHQVSNELNDSSTLAHLYQVLSNIHLNSKKPDSAKVYGQLSYDIANAMDNPTYMFHASSMMRMACDSLGQIDEAYQWSLENNRLMNLHYEDLKGTDIRIVQLEAERSQQELENRLLKKARAREELYNKQSERISIFAAFVAAIFILIAFYLSVQRKKLVQTTKLLEQKNEEIEQKNIELTRYINVRDKLISVASHDLRAPLSTLKNLLEVFKYPDLSPEEIKDAVLALEAQYERSIDMADNLLLWVKAQLQGIEPNIKTFDIVEMSTELETIFSALLSTANVEVNIIGTKDVLVKADQEMIKFVMRNLMHNAIKYSPPKSTIEIEILEFDNHVKWNVKDQGKGMPPADLDQLFEMNKVTDATDPNRGAGIGLYLSKLFAEMNEGDLKVKSEIGLGTAMSLILPKSKRN